MVTGALLDAIPRGRIRAVPAISVGIGVCFGMLAEMNAETFVVVMTAVDVAPAAPFEDSSS